MFRFCLLCLQGFDAWALPVESICMQIFYISLSVRPLPWYIYCVSPVRRGESESLRIDLLGSLWLFVPLCVCVCVCVWVAESDTRRRRNRGGRKEDSVCVCLDSHSSFLIHYFFFCPILSASLGHPENSSICDFKRPSSLVPLALWGKTSYSLISLLFFIFSILTASEGRCAKQVHKKYQSLISDIIITGHNVSIFLL